VVCEGTELSYAELDERAVGWRNCWRVGVWAGVCGGGVCAAFGGDGGGVAGGGEGGGAYLPIDPGYPAQRVEFMLADAGPALVLTSTVSALPEQVSVRVPVVVLDDPVVVAQLAEAARGMLFTVGIVGGASSVCDVHVWFYGPA